MSVIKCDEIKIIKEEGQLLLVNKVFTAILWTETTDSLSLDSDREEMCGDAEAGMDNVGLDSKRNTGELQY